MAPCPLQPDGSSRSPLCLLKNRVCAGPLSRSLIPLRIAAMGPWPLFGKFWDIFSTTGPCVECRFTDMSLLFEGISELAAIHMKMNPWDRQAKSLSLSGLRARRRVGAGGVVVGTTVEAPIAALPPAPSDVRIIYDPIKTICARRAQADEMKPAL